MDCTISIFNTTNPKTLEQLTMAKRFKLRLSIPSFQLCRSKNPFSFPKNPPPPATIPTYLFSPINLKAFEIAYPNFPDPPPTTPTNNNPSSSKRHLSSKVSPLSHSFHLQPNHHKTCNSPTSFDSSDVANLPVSSVWDVSSEDEAESLFTSSTSFDDDASSFDANKYSGGIKKTSRKIKSRKLKKYVSNKWKISSSETELEIDDDNNKSGGRKKKKKPFLSSLVLRRLMAQCKAEGKVKESYAVVTRSDDPYEDFKRSMLEMILEKQMFEAKELEELLHCFLSLNSPHHHSVIVAAFTEIWEVLFL